MSEFECREGHLIPPGKVRCPICGGRIHKMDGQSAEEIEADEREGYDDEGENGGEE